MKTKRWRAEEGAPYYYISNCTLDVVEEKDYAYEALDRWGIGNYFHTKEDAEAMARKIRAVLNGADVIEMPREEDIDKKVTNEWLWYKYESENEVHDKDAYFKAFDDAVKWLKSKIVKCYE